MEMAKDPSYLMEFSNIVSDMQAKFDKYYSEYNLALSCAIILDPRCKVTFLKYCFRKVYGSKGVGSWVEKVINTLRIWFEEYMRVSSSESS